MQQSFLGTMLHTDFALLLFLLGVVVEYCMNPFPWHTGMLGTEKMSLLLLCIVLMYFIILMR